MWSTSEHPWVLSTPRFASDDLDPTHAVGPWSGHRNFVYDLVAWGGPDVVVELGARSGAVLFACCQAVRDRGRTATLHAVDSWELSSTGADGGVEVVERIRASVFPGLDVHLHRGLAHDALVAVDDESVDLLVLGIVESFDELKDTFEAWLPKLAPNGVVLLHGVASWTRTGSAQLWGEVSSTNPSLAFEHSFGLGLLLPKGTERLDVLVGDELARWKSYYEVRARAALDELQLREHTAALEARDSTIADHEREIDVLRSEVEITRRELEHAGRVATGDEGGDVAAAPPIVPVTMTRRILRKLLRGARRAVRVTNRHLGTNLRITIGGAADLDERLASVFDAEYYLDRYPDVAAARVDPLEHYRSSGWTEGRDPSALFWTDWYLRRYRDVAALGRNPLEHHLEQGWVVGHDPSPLLRTRWYLDRHPEVRATGRSPLEHYWTVGYATGFYANPEQRRRATSAGALPPSAQRTIVECELLTPDQPARLVTLDALARADVELVTFDLWDTLVVRTRPADAPKLATARRIFLRHHRDLPEGTTPWDLFRGRVAAEAAIAASSAHEEYRLDDVLSRHLSEVLGLSARKARPIAAELAREEAEEECRCTERIDDVVAVLEALRDRPTPPKLAVLSDFYLSANDLSAVLESCGVVLDDIEVLCSCDVSASKRVDGELFELVRSRFGVAPERHLHIGDNPWSDGERQVAGGGLAALVRISPSPLPGPGELTPEHLGALVAAQHDDLLRVVDVLVSDAGRGETERRAAHAGVLTALLPVALVAAAVEEALGRGLRSVYYLSREGAFLRQVHDLVAPRLAGSMTPPVGRHLDVSRRSTFGVSLSSLQPQELSRMWSQYADQSPRALFESIGVGADGFAEEVLAVGLSLDEVVPSIADDERALALLELPEVRARVEAKLDDRRRAFEAYLHQQIDDSERELVMVDVGWRGTIQDNLARLLPERRLVGVYLGLFPFLNEQLANVTKHAVAFDGNAGEPFTLVSPPAAIEAPLTPDVPSVVDYAIRADGRSMPVHEHEGPRASSEIRSFQAGVLAAAPRVADWLVENGLTTSMLRRELNETVIDYYGRPPGGVADIWFGSSHDDTFGAMNVSPFAKEQPQRSLLSRVGATEVVSEEARRSQWVPGYRAWLPARALEILREMWKELH
ncbi:MAG: class I SAM-dependent methyltransferase [Acidimicrobiia bacterium]